MDKNKEKTMCLEFEGTKFWLLEHKIENSKSKNWLLGDEHSVADKVKELLEIVDVNNIMVYVIDTSKDHEWNISSVDWSEIISMLYKKPT